MKKRRRNGKHINVHGSSALGLIWEKYCLKCSTINILFLTDNFPPEVNAPATRTYEHCREWVQSGAKVTVVTCFPNFPTGRVFHGYKNLLYAREVIDGIEVIRVWTYITANEGLIKRTLDYMSFAFIAIFTSMRIKFDVAIATSPQFFTALAGMILSKFKRKPWIMEVRDLWPESILAVGAIDNRIIISLLKKLEKKCYISATKIISVTDSFKRVIVSDGIQPDKISVVKNGVNHALFTPRDKDKQLLAEHCLDNKFLVGYIGTLGIAHGLDFIVDSAEAIKDDHIHIVLMGEGANKKKLRKNIQNRDLANISIIDSVPKQEIVDYIASIDVALINLKKAPLFKTVIPSKIFENAAMGKPILLGVNGEARQIIEDYSAGLYFEPENQSDFVEKLLLLKNDKNLYKTCQRGCRKLAKDFDRRKLAKKMFFDIESTLDISL